MSDGIFGYIPFNTTTTIKKQLPTIIIGSLTLIATLAWNEAFKSLIDQYIPEEYRGTKNAWMKVSYALTLTIIIIIVMSVIIKVSH